MKFAIHLSNEKGKVLWRASGIGSLPEACAAAVAVAGFHCGEAMFVNIETAGKVVCGSHHHFGGICCDSLENFSLKYVRERADVEMTRLKQKQRDHRARDKFLKEHGGYDGDFFRMIVPPHNPLKGGYTLGDEELRKCYFSNDFAGALRRFEELKKGQVAA